MRSGGVEWPRGAELPQWSELRARSCLSRLRLLTVHLISSRDIASEFAGRLGNFDEFFYRRQPQHAVLVATAGDDRITAATMGLAPDAANVGSPPSACGALHRYRQGPTKFILQHVRAELPGALRVVNRTLIPESECASQRWKLDYALYSGAFFTYHLLRMPLIASADFYLKLDTDVLFVQAMPDVWSMIARRDQVAIGYTQFHSKRFLKARGWDDCQAGIMAAVQRFASAFHAEPLSSWCRDPKPQFWAGYVMLFNTSFMTNPRVLALSEYLYERAWEGYFRSRWTDQAPYMAFACYALEVPEPGSQNDSTPHIQDLSSLRSHFVHGKKNRKARNSYLVRLAGAPSTPGAGQAGDCRVSLTRQRSRHAICVQSRDGAAINSTFGCVGNSTSAAVWVSLGCRGDFDCNGHAVQCGLVARGADPEQRCDCVSVVRPTVPFFRGG